MAFPSVCDNIPTKANQEDHVSMAPWAARKAQLGLHRLEQFIRLYQPDGRLGLVAHVDVLRLAFIDAGAVQCGFCTPGMILAAKALLDREPRPSRSPWPESRGCAPERHMPYPAGAGRRYTLPALWPSPAIPADEISLRLNGREKRFRVEERETLLQVLRERAGLTGAKNGTPAAARCPESFPDS